MQVRNKKIEKSCEKNPCLRYDKSSGLQMVWTQDMFLTEVRLGGPPSRAT